MINKIQKNKKLYCVIVIIVLFVLFFDSYSKSKKDSYRKLNDIAISFFSAGEYKKSIQYADKAIGIGYRDYDQKLISYMIKAHSLYKLQKYEESLNFYHKSYEIVKKKPALERFLFQEQFFIQFSVAEEFAGDIEKARKLLITSLNYKGDSYAVFFRLACLEVVYFRNNQKAFDYFQRAKQIDPISFDMDPKRIISNLMKSKQYYINYLNKLL